MLEIYCDGAYSSKRNIGGWAFVVIKDNIKIESKWAPEYNTTNNRMELQAVIEACKWLLQQQIFIAYIYSDSMYVIGTLTQNWKKNKNIDLWNILIPLIFNLQITWNHIKGHSGNKYNELCDALANNATFINN